jgi:hypothetical protein
MLNNPDRPEESFTEAFRRAMGEDPPPIPEGQVRPLCDPEAVMRWFALREPIEPEWEYNPFSRDRMNK